MGGVRGGGTRQALHPDLTLTGMYNVLEKLRAGEPLSPKDKIVNEQGLVSVLKQIHDEIDAAVFEAYGWPASLNDEEILERIVALNTARAAEERRGIIRWLRPEFQRGSDVEPQNEALDLVELSSATLKSVASSTWPKTLADQVAAVLRALPALGAADARIVARTFKGARADKVSDVLDALAMVGSVHRLPDGRFATPAA